MNIETYSFDRMSSWVLRLQLNAEKVAVKANGIDLKMSTIAEKIENQYQGAVHVLFTDDNHRQDDSICLVLRIRIIVDEADQMAEPEESQEGGEFDLMRRMEKDLLGLQICGIPGIKKVESSLRCTCCVIVYVRLNYEDIFLWLLILIRVFFHFRLSFSSPAATATAAVPTAFIWL